mmetsp:Transcript_36512/g.66925  ORF Transcript_36512/g.66925 Transcript_36512/m.66925 type:complete len:274 (+) Transcript_36512:44-865(+)
MELVECAQARGLIIGQSPPVPPERLPEGYQPLQGGPERRLAKLAGFASAEELWAVFDRIDLLGWCPGPKDRKDYHLLSCGYRKHCCDGHRFPLRAARIAAGRLKTFAGLAQDYSIVVLCGRLVAAAFGLQLRCVPFAEEVEGIRFLVMPHPSGVSHFWNDDRSWLRAAAAFRAALLIAELLPSDTALAMQTFKEGSAGAEDQVLEDAATCVKSRARSTPDVKNTGRKKKSQRQRRAASSGRIPEVHLQTRRRSRFFHLKGARRVKNSMPNEFK